MLNYSVGREMIWKTKWVFPRGHQMVMLETINKQSNKKKRCSMQVLMQKKHRKSINELKNKETDMTKIEAGDMAQVRYHDCLAFTEFYMLSPAPQKSQLLVHTFCPSTWEVKAAIQ